MTPSSQETTAARLRSLSGPALVAFLGWIAVAAALDPAGNYPGLPAGPGLSLDESFNAEQGVYLVEALRGYGWAALHPETLREIFNHPAYLADHPPFGRFWLGLSHQMTRSLLPALPEGLPILIACARTGSTIAFGLLVFLVATVAHRWYGRAGGLTAGAALILMPRVFGHAHLAALETWLNLTYTAAVVSVAALGARRPSPSLGAAMAAGFVFGLALLTKIQAILLPLPVFVWALWNWRSRAVVPLLLWSVTGGAVFLLGWPWLWSAPVDRLVDYLTRGIERAELFVWYFGQRYADHAVPWHYPLVMFVATSPLGLLLLGFLGLLAGRQPTWQSPREQLLLACCVFPLIVFGLPGVVVYDGVRLFLVSFPLWALLVGRGTAIGLEWFCQRWSRPWGAGLLALLLALQGSGGVGLHPCYLSHYNLLVGGLRGAERLGLEPTYWGESITRGLLQDVIRDVPAGSTVAVAPVLHQFQLEVLQQQSPLLRRHRIVLRPFEPKAAEKGQFVLFFRRKADLPPALREPPVEHGDLLAEVRRDGVQLAALYRLNGPLANP